MNDLILDWTTQYFTEPEHTDFEGHPSEFEAESLSETSIGQQHYQLSCRITKRRTQHGQPLVIEELLTFTGEFDGYDAIYVRKSPLPGPLSLEELTTSCLLRAERKIVSPMQQLARRLETP